MSFKRTFNRSQMQGRRARQGQSNRLARRRATIQSKRQFVPRTMGAFAQTETKYFDSFLSASNIAESADWTGTEVDPATLLNLFNPVEGSDLDNRVGRKVLVKRIAMRGVITATTEADQADVLALPQVRLILFQDMQTNGSQAQGEQVMASPGAATTALTFCTFQNTANFGRFRVLRDVVIRLGQQVTATDGTNTSSQNMQHIPFKLTFRFKQPVAVRFNATNGGTIGDIVDNSFHLLAQKSGANFTHQISYQCRTYYKDM